MATEQRERPLHELLSRDMVDVYVGAENTHWILHEKLLCHRSAFFRSVFYEKQKRSANKAFGLPDDDDDAFRYFVGWLYSDTVPPVRQETELAPLFELYLMGERWKISALVRAALDAVRAYYRDSDSVPGLRRVQYIYANTDGDSGMRRLLVGAVARMLVTGNGLQSHWDKALRKNGQLAVDLILEIQRWRLDPSALPDVRQDLESVQEGVRKVEGEEEDLAHRVKTEDDDEPTLANRVDGLDEEDHPMVNGVDHSEEE